MSNDVWSIVLLIGLIGWMTSTLIFIFRAFPGPDRFEVRPARLWGGSVLLFFMVWIIGLLNA